jgi:hypothetical protein
VDLIDKKYNHLEVEEGKYNIWKENGHFKKLSFTGKYLNCTTNEDTFYVYDLMNNKIISDTFSLAGNEGKTILEETNLKVYIGNSLRQTIKLSFPTINKTFII